MLYGADNEEYHYTTGDLIVLTRQDMNEFLNLKVTGEADIWSSDEDGGVGNVVWTNRGICLYHGSGDWWNEEAFYTICNIVDIGFNEGLTVSNQTLPRTK